MNIKEALSHGRDFLQNSKISSYKIDSLILLGFCLDKNKEFILFNPEVQLSSSQQDLFGKLIKRRQKSEPISHIIKKREFYNRDFIVNSDVLDPRADSEILIETILKYFDKDQELQILELGLGSGCLSITLLCELINSNITGVDISMDAIKVANLNAKKHHVTKRLKIINSNLFEKLKSNDKFDLIISNPPYIESSQIPQLAKDVRLFEPIIALDGGVDGLDFYRQIALNAHKFLTKNGHIIVEIGINQENEIIAIFEEKNYKLISLNKDLAGIIRILHFKI